AKLVKGETVDLCVPADSAIVIEGVLHPTRTAIDGPSPGPSMLFTPYANPQPVFEASAIAMSEAPIYRNHLEAPFTGSSGAAAAVPGGDHLGSHPRHGYSDSRSHLPAGWCNARPDLATGPGGRRAGGRRVAVSYERLHEQQ